MQAGEIHRNFRVTLRVLYPDVLSVSPVNRDERRFEHGVEPFADVRAEVHELALVHAGASESPLDLGLTNASSTFAWEATSRTMTIDRLQRSRLSDSTRFRPVSGWS